VAGRGQHFLAGWVEVRWESSGREFLRLIRGWTRERRTGTVGWAYVRGVSYARNWCTLPYHGGSCSERISELWKLLSVCVSCEYRCLALSIALVSFLSMSAVSACSSVIRRIALGRREGQAIYYIAPLWLSALCPQIVRLRIFMLNVTYGNSWLK